MALLYITEYGALQDGVLAKTAMIVNQAPVAVGGAAVLSAVFRNGTRYARLHLDTNGGFGANVDIGTNPIAIANVSMRIAPNATEYFGVNPGDRVSVILATV